MGDKKENILLILGIFIFIIIILGEIYFPEYKNLGGCFIWKK